MKKLLALGLALYASSAFAVISSSKHNMNNYGGVGSRTGDPCYYCHSAHNAVTVPLWARNQSTATYTYYTSSTVSVNLSGTPAAALDTVSNACLSCHDGTIGIATTIKGQIGGGTNPTIPTGNTRIGPNLSNDHPVGLVWNTSYAGLAATTAISPFKIYAVVGGNGISCASCHLVHGGVSTANGKQFMRADATAGAFCITCHINK